MLTYAHYFRDLCRDVAFHFVHVYIVEMLRPGLLEAGASIHPPTETAQKASTPPESPHTNSSNGCYPVPLCIIQYTVLKQRLFSEHFGMVD